jgi:hypothetical protein
MMTNPDASTTSLPFLVVSALIVGCAGATEEIASVAQPW